ncbi:MAG: hypothetical protein AAF298_09590 [Cyanobacteria bacterium P01_A01_bin.40]
MTLQEVLQLAKQLTPIDKVRLIQQLTPDLERELSQTKSKPKKSLLGLCADLGKAPSESEIDLVRDEVWSKFPREDI